MILRGIPFLLLVALSGCGGDSPTAVEPAPIPEVVQALPVSIQTRDGFILQGTLFTPDDQAAPRPPIILLHAFTSNRAEWTPFVPDLVRQGYVALAFDLRGHGQSANKNGQAVTYNSFTFADIDNMPQDVEAAIAWLKTRPEADPQRIGLIGASIGANIAFISSALYPDIKTTVSISPRLRHDQETLTGQNIPNFQPHSVFYLAAYGDEYTYTSSEDLANNTQAPTRVIGYQGTAHGTELLDNPEAWSEVLSWLEQYL